MCAVVIVVIIIVVIVIFRERGITKRINQSSLDAMMARDPWATQSCCCVVSAASRAGLAWGDRMNRTWEEKRGGDIPARTV